MIPYRNLVNQKRRFFAQVAYRHTDMWLTGTNPMLADTHTLRRTKQKLTSLYEKLEHHMAAYPDFRHSLSPVDSPSLEPIVRDMSGAAREAGVGPMAAVAGAFADHVLRDLADDEHDLCVENGGDLSLVCRKTTKIRIYAGWNHSKTPISLVLPTGRYGVASSSGRFGHSLSLGKADMVTAIAGTGALADAYATATANRITPGTDLQEVAETVSGPLAVAIVCQGTFAYRGPFDLDFK